MMRLNPRLGAAILAVAFTSACSGSDSGDGDESSVGGEEASGGGTETSTGGVAGADTGRGGSALDNGGSVATNGGSVIGNGGSVVGRGGAVTGNGGAVPTNGGAVTGNGGAVPTNGGAVTGNGGATTGDGGATINNGGMVVGNGGLVVADGGAAIGEGGAAAGEGGSVAGNGQGGEPGEGGAVGEGGAELGGDGMGGLPAGGSGGESTEVCTRWNDAHVDLSEGEWTGSVESCTVGDMSATTRETALRLLNLYRWMAGLPEVAMSEEYNQMDQACALMMQANDELDHSPPNTWDCYSEVGAQAAQNSCLDAEGSVASISAYFVDPGNETTLGHRRWMLSSYLGPVGFGSTGDYSCLHTGMSGTADRDWTAWPPPGQFPIQATTDQWDRTLNTTGWSIQSDTIRLADASVSITLDGNDQPVTVSDLASGYGSEYAISLVPQGWEMAVGNRYHVELSGLSEPISYDVEVVSCD